MELEPFSNLAWLLLGGGAFFAAMRLAANRHSAGDDRLDSMEARDVTVLRRAPARDPVCGMALDPFWPGSNGSHGSSNRCRMSAR